jgi:phenol 2-monooxygenase (NADPH)
VEWEEGHQASTDLFPSMTSASANGTHVDVLIVGAGPAGLMAATALARAGVNVKIIDIRQVLVTLYWYLCSTLTAEHRPKSVPNGQADGIMPRTIEVFQVCVHR